MTFHFAVCVVYLKSAVFLGDVNWRIQREASHRNSSPPHRVRLCETDLHNTKWVAWSSDIFLCKYCLSHITLWCSHLKLKREKNENENTLVGRGCLLQLGEGSLVDVWHCCCSKSNQCTTTTTHSRNQWAQRSLGRIYVELYVRVCCPRAHTMCMVDNSLYSTLTK